MQHLSVYSDKSPSAQVAEKSYKTPHLFVRSRSLTSMLPSFLSTGLVTLIVSAVLRLVWVGFNNEFFSAWMEAWLTTWPIAFPLAYVITPLLKRLRQQGQASQHQTTISLNNSLAKRVPPHAPYFR